MSCESVDLKEYFFGEASVAVRRGIESHLETCDHCRDELSRLQLTQAALGALRDEEMPRRIAFVSDKVFEPRWYQRLWNSGPQLGFIAASLLAGAIMVHAFTRPAPVVNTAQSVQIDQAVIDREVARRVDAAVTKAVAEVETRQQQKTAQLLAAADKKYELDRRSVIEAISAENRFVQKALTMNYALANNMRSDGQ